MIKLLVGSLLAITGAIVGVYLAYQPPNFDALVYLPSLSKYGGEEVKVYRDERGHVSIEGQSVEQTVYAQGFVHAQDRLWQMQTQRKMAAGKLAELHSLPASTIDQEMADAAFYQLANKTWSGADSDGKPYLTEAQKAILTAYADGVNDFIYALTEATPLQGILPPEFWLTWTSSPEPWTPQDSLAIMKMQTYRLTDKTEESIAALRADPALKEVIDKVFRKDKNLLLRDTPTTILSSQDVEAWLSRIHPDHDEEPQEMPANSHGSEQSGEQAESPASEEVPEDSYNSDEIEQASMGADEQVTMEQEQEPEQEPEIVESEPSVTAPEPTVIEPEQAISEPELTTPEPLEPEVTKQNESVEQPPSQTPEEEIVIEESAQNSEEIKTEPETPEIPETLQVAKQSEEPEGPELVESEEPGIPTEDTAPGEEETMEVDVELEQQPDDQLVQQPIESLVEAVPTDQEASPEDDIQEETASQLEEEIIEQPEQPEGLREDAHGETQEKVLEDVLADVQEEVPEVVLEAAAKEDEQQELGEEPTTSNNDGFENAEPLPPHEEAETIDESEPKVVEGQPLTEATIPDEVIPGDQDQDQITEDDLASDSITEEFEVAQEPGDLQSEEEEDQQREIMQVATEETPEEEDFDSGSSNLDLKEGETVEIAIEAEPEIVPENAPPSSSHEEEKEVSVAEANEELQDTEVEVTTMEQEQLEDEPLEDPQAHLEDHDSASGEGEVKVQDQEHQRQSEVSEDEEPVEKIESHEAEEDEEGASDASDASASLETPEEEPYVPADHIEAEQASEISEPTEASSVEEEEPVEETPIEKPSEEQGESHEDLQDEPPAAEEGKKKFVIGNMTHEEVQAHLSKVAEERLRRHQELHDQHQAQQEAQDQEEVGLEAIDPESSSEHESSPAEGEMEAAHESAEEPSELSGEQEVLSEKPEEPSPSAEAPEEYSEQEAKPEDSEPTPEATPDSSRRRRRRSSEPEASNAFVISGMHTKTGSPLLAGDPHYETAAPSFFVANSLSFLTDQGIEQSLKGASHPGFPLIEMGTSNSIAWAISAAMVDQPLVPGETWLDFLEWVIGCDTLECLHEQYQGSWSSLPVNLALADTSGNIGYSMLAAAEIGGEVLPLEKLPFIMNPESGYFILANQRVASDLEISDRGDETVRALRIKDLISSKQKAKISVEDMLQIQTDVTDISARQLAKMAVHIGRTRENLLPAEKRGGAVHIRDILGHFEGEMSAESKEAAIFSVWHYFYLSHFKQFSKLSGFNQFRNFAANVLISLVNNPYGDNGLEDNCEAGSKPTPVGSCTYASLEALSQTYEHLTATLGEDESNWTWGALHKIIYSNEVVDTKLQGSLNWQNLKNFSKTVPASGNWNTPFAASYDISKAETDMNSQHASVFRQVVDMKPASKAANPDFLMAVDTGAGGNVFGPHYFDQNADFMAGKMEAAKEPKKHLTVLRPSTGKADQSLLGWVRWLKGK